MKKAIFIISALTVASLLGGLALSCSPFDSPYYTEDEVCAAICTLSQRGLLKSTASAEYQGDHVWRFKATRVEHHEVWVPNPEYVPPKFDDTASLEEILEALRNPDFPERGHSEWVRQEVKVEALFYERTGVVEWVTWY